MSASGLLKLPYDQRRIIVVTDKVPAVASTRRYGWHEILGMVSPSSALTSMAVEAIIEARNKMRQGGEELVPVSWTDANALQFPVGHPRKNVVYIGHPVDPPAYIPVADFHRFLFRAQSRRSPETDPIPRRANGRRDTC